MSIIGFGAVVKMTSKWIEEVLSTFPTNGGEYDSNNALIVLERIDNLLRKSLDTDNDNLYEELRKELDGTD